MSVITPKKAEQIWGVMEWLADDHLAPSPGLSLARMTVFRDQTSSGHRHPNCSEVIHVERGKISQRIDEDWIAMNEGDTVLIPIGASHQTRNCGECDAVLLVAYSAGTRAYEDCA